MTDRMPPQADGLYDPRYEHDACGVAMVARLDNVPAPRRRAARRSWRSTTSSTAGPRAPTPTPATAPGILLQLPDALLPRGVDFELPAARALRRLRLLPAARRARAAAELEELLELNVARRGPARARLARRARRQGPRRRSPPTPRARTSSSSSSGAAAGFEHDQDAFERKLYVIRRIAELAAGPELVLAVASPAARSSTRACSRPRSCSASTPTCRTSARSRAGARPLALLDQHLPELGAGPPVPR